MQYTSTRTVLMDARMAGPLFMLSAALLFTLMSTIVKLMPEQYTVWHLGFIRCFGGMILLTTVFSRRKNPFKGHKVPLLILRGCTGSLAFFFVVSALRILPMSTAVVLFYSYPAFAALFGFLIYRERLNRFQIACIAVLLAGVAILFDFRLSANALGQAMAIIGAVLAGFTVTIIRSLREHNGPVIIYFYFCTMGTLATLPYCIAHPIVPASAVEWTMAGGIIFVSVAAQLLMNQGFFFCKGFEGAAYMSSETLFTAVVGIVFLMEPVSWHLFAGGLLIVGSGLAMHRLGRIKLK
jgi:drug/metabolite transporter (DMT)-like permease